MLEQTKEALKNKFYEVGAIKFGKHVLSSGKETECFVDVKKVAFDPDGFDMLGELGSYYIYNKERCNGKMYNLASVATGGTYVAQSIMVKLRRPVISVTIRPDNVRYPISGNFEEYKSYALIKDVISTAISALKAASLIGDNGSEVEYVLAVVDLEMGGADALQDAGLDFDSMLTKSELGLDID